MTTQDKSLTARIHVQCDSCGEWFAPVITKTPGMTEIRVRCGRCRTTHHYTFGEIGGSAT